MKISSLFVAGALLVAAESYAALKTTPAEENAIKVVKSAYRFGSVKDALKHFKDLSQSNVDFDSLIDSVESTESASERALAKLQDEATVKTISALAVTTIDKVAAGVRSFEKESKLFGPDKQLATDIYAFQIELGGGKEVPASPSVGFEEYFNEAFDSFQVLTEYSSDFTEPRATKVNGILKTVAEKLSKAKGHFDTYAETESQFSLTFGCASLSEISVTLATLDLAVGTPDNQDKTWRKGVDGMRDAAERARTAYSCQ